MTNLSAQIETLREAFGGLERMSDAHYNRLVAILDRASDEALLAAYNAKIAFVSTLAFNRCLRRGLISRAS